MIFFLVHLAVSWLDANGWIWPLVLFGWLRVFWLSVVFVRALIYSTDDNM